MAREKCSECGEETACDVCGAPSDTCWDTDWEGSCGNGVCSNKQCARYGQHPARVQHVLACVLFGAAVQQTHLETNTASGDAVSACNEPGCTADAVDGSTRCLEHRDLIDTEVFALGDPPRNEDDYGDDEFYEEDEYESALSDCHMGSDGQCGAAGSEWCEFECPVMRDWRREPWDEHGPIANQGHSSAPSIALEGDDIKATITEGTK